MTDAECQHLFHENENNVQVKMGGKTELKLFCFLFKLIYSSNVMTTQFIREMVHFFIFIHLILSLLKYTNVILIKERLYNNFS